MQAVQRKKGALKETKAAIALITRRRPEYR
jgi:hypothetical protein